MFMDGYYQDGPFLEEVCKVHSTYPSFMPKARTIGTVIRTHTAPLYKDSYALIQWPSGSTSGKDQWWCPMDLLLELSHCRIDADEFIPVHLNFHSN